MPCLKVSIVLAIALFLTFATSLSADADVRITVKRTDAGGVATYVYTVHNDTSERIVSVRIGLDYLHGVAELRTPPVGWQLASGLPPSSTMSPEGWTPALITEEESEYFNLEWNSGDTASFDIAPQATVTGFGVRVPVAAAEYRLPQFDIVFGDTTHAYGRVEITSGKQRAVRH